MALSPPVVQFLPCGSYANRQFVPIYLGFLSSYSVKISTFHFAVNAYVAQ